MTTTLGGTYGTSNGAVYGEQPEGYFDLSEWNTSGDAKILGLDSAAAKLGSHAAEWVIDASKSSNENAVYTINGELIQDVSQEFGTTSGSFTQGTLAIWMRIENSSILRGTDAVRIRFGSSPSNYAEWTLDSSEFGADGVMNYYTFSHDEYDSITGTPDWTAADYIEITFFEASGNTTDTTLYMDYLTVSENNNIGLNPLGDRRSSKKQVTTG